MFDVIQTPFQYPESSEFNNIPGLIPGESYNWRARAYSVTGKTPWSNTNTFEIHAIELIEPEVGQRLETVRPYFNFITPKNIAHYVLMISDEEDEDVVVGNVYRNEISVWPRKKRLINAGHFFSRRMSKIIISSSSCSAIFLS